MQSCCPPDGADLLPARWCGPAAHPTVQNCSPDSAILLPAQRCRPAACQMVQSCCLEFNCQNPHKGGKKEATPQGCPLIPTYVPRHTQHAYITYIHTHIYTHDNSNNNKVNFKADNRAIEMTQQVRVLATMPADLSLTSSGKRKPTSASCPLTSIHVLTHNKYFLNLKKKVDNAFINAPLGLFAYHPSLVTAAHSPKWHDPTFGMILISEFCVNQVGL